MSPVTSPRWTDAAPMPFWLDSPSRPEPRPAHSGIVDVDLVVIGAGFTGLWAALQALEAAPGSSVLVLEADRIAANATGRNGGFCVASLTHGDANGRARWPRDMPVLRRLGDENLAAIVDTIERYDLDVELERTGELDVAIAPWQVDDLLEESAVLTDAGVAHTFFDEASIASEITSPLALAGLLDETGAVMVNPARLAWGLAGVIERLGGTIAEHSKVTSIDRDQTGVLATTPGGVVRAKRCIVATSCFPALVKRTALRVVPVYDYVLMTEPLNEAQLASIGWRNRRGIGDAGNQFHYLRLSADNRILFGGYEAVYRFRQQVRPDFDQDPAVFSVLEEHFDAMFPTLGEVGFSHRWGGAIDTSTRFCASVTLSHDDRVATVNGFTGLGVGASRFFAAAALDLLAERTTPATLLEMVRSAPVPFPPEPIRYLGITATRHAIARADANDGRRGAWLRLLDALGLGFDS